MPDQQANSHPHIPNGFQIPVHAETVANFPHQRELVIVLGAAHAGYQLFHKQIPGSMKAKQHRGKTIQWMNNFGLKEKGKPAYSDAVPQYEILLDQIPNAEYVYYNGNEILTLATRPSETYPDKVVAVLSLGDPPVGWVG